jgi:hypothetical protein
LQSAEHQIALLLKSVHELEETTARLLTHRTTSPSLPPSLPSSFFVEEMSAKRLGEVEDFSEALGFGGGILHQQHDPSSLPPSPPASGSQDRWEGGKKGDPASPPPQPRQHHAYKRREERSGGREGATEGGKVRVVVQWLEWVGRYHEERLQEGWERMKRWFF